MLSNNLLDAQEVLEMITKYEKDAFHEFKGKSAFQGIAIGKLYLYKGASLQPEKRWIENPEKEVGRFHKARETAMKELEVLYERAVGKVGEEHAMIFKVHRMMLEDIDFINHAVDKIKRQSLNAEYAVQLVGEEMSQVFLCLEDDYMRARSADVLDISKRVVDNLMGIEARGIHTEEPVIILADDLTPSETISMDKSKILAFVTKNGSLNSHTAILARSMNLPALMGVDVELLDRYHGKLAVVDAVDGILVINPKKEQLRTLTLKKLQWDHEKDKLQSLVGKETKTKDGRTIQLCANIGNASDVRSVLENDGDGIGLFRSEFLYLGREEYPSEEEQFCNYKEVLEKMKGKKVIIRTLDIGTDKQTCYLELPKEENPAMGYRGIRISLDRISMFKDQLRAIYRASHYGTAGIMFPMITSVQEVLRIKKIVEEVKQELKERGEKYGDVELGIMVETPAAALISDELAELVDFFSLGTNDLTQYTLAVDRQNPSLDNWYDAHHKAILLLIRMTVENGHKKGIWVGICGELAGDLTLTETFLAMGIDELSVSPPYILEVRKKIRSIE